MNHFYKKLFFRLLSGIQDGYLEVVCPRETYSFGMPSAKLKAMLVIQDERFFFRALFGGDIGMGEAFMDGDWASPDLYSLLRLAVRNTERFENDNRASRLLLSLVERIRHRLRSNTLKGSQKNISQHYDLGNDFYRLFLDSTMAYSCACFHSPEDSLEQAQLNKYELICRKLDLKSTDRLLEIGTGWGGFAAYVARHYGCRITTTTISHQQFEYARQLFDAMGEAGKRIELLLSDYRNLEGQFDKIVSIEMFEAVGLEFYDTYFAICDRLLAEDGCMLLQTISMPDQKFAAYRSSSDWIKKYIFPGGELASVAGIVASLGRSTRLTLFHAENIGMHYAETLHHWRERFLAHREQAAAVGFDGRSLRMWEFYLTYCEAAFYERHIGLHQFFLTKPAYPASLHGHTSQVRHATAAVGRRS